MQDPAREGTERVPGECPPSPGPGVTSSNRRCRQSLDATNFFLADVRDGAISTARGLGAALSTDVAGVIVVRADYSAAFLCLAAVAAAGLALFLFGMGETRRRERVDTPDAAYTAPVGAPAAAG